MRHFSRTAALLCILATSVSAANEIKLVQSLTAQWKSWHAQMPVPPQATPNAKKKS